MKTEYVTNGDHTNIHVHMKSYNGKQFCHKKEKKNDTNVNIIIYHINMCKHSVSKPQF